MPYPLPPPPQTILPRIFFISSKEKARSVSGRTLPREQTLNESAVAASSSGALAERNDVVPAKRPIKILDDNAALLGHLLEGLRPADRLLDVADALIREASEHDKGSHRSPPLWPPAQ